MELIFYLAPILCVLSFIMMVFYSSKVAEYDDPIEKLFYKKKAISSLIAFGILFICSLPTIVIFVSLATGNYY